VVYGGFACVGELAAGLHETRDMIEKHLDESLGRLVARFQPGFFEQIILSFDALRGDPTQAAERLSTHFVSTVLAVARATLTEHTSREGGAMDEGAVASPLGRKRAQSVTRTNFKALCQMLKPEDFRPCLMDLCRNLCDMMVTFRSVETWYAQHLKQLAEAEATEQELVGSSGAVTPANESVQASKAPSEDPSALPSDSEEAEEAEGQGEETVNGEATEPEAELEEGTDGEVVAEEASDGEAPVEEAEADGAEATAGTGTEGDGETGVEATTTEHSRNGTAMLAGAAGGRYSAVDYAALKLQQARQRLWQDVQRLVGIFLAAADLRALDLDTYLRVLRQITRLMEVGEGFSGQDAAILALAVRQTSLAYASALHTESLERLLDMLAVETWQAVSVAPDWNMYHLPEYQFLRRRRSPNSASGADFGE